jgi:hypothetical protein
MPFEERVLGNKRTLDETAKFTGFLRLANVDILEGNVDSDVTSCASGAQTSSIASKTDAPLSGDRPGHDEVFLLFQIQLFGIAK